jgi:hypothetical protein
VETPRAKHPATLRELSRNLEHIVPFDSRTILTESKATQLWEELPFAATRRRIFFDRDSRLLSFFAFEPQGTKPSSGLTIRVLRELTAVDLKLCKDFVRVLIQT